MGGQGEGIDRNVRFYTTGAVGQFRSERFVDRRDLATNAALDDAGTQWLIDHAGAPSLTFEPVDGAGAVFGVDYRVGDVVRFDTPGVSSAHRIVSARTSITPDAVTRTVTAGALAATGDEALLRSIVATRRRIAALESNY
jgi:hypothetical protein